MKHILLLLTALALLLGGVGQARAGMFTFTGNIQNFTVPTTGLYDITVAGAQGGSGHGTTGGEGAVLSGEILLTKNEMLQIVVGGHGANGSFTGGGGGGSFVYINGPPSPPLIVAGGGGGGGFVVNGGSGQIVMSGQNGFVGTAGGMGGTGGNGGGGGVGADSGGGGAGWLGNGSDGTGTAHGLGGFGPTTFAGGGNTTFGSNGGFGGGGGSGSDGGGGGGGYSGGGGGSGAGGAGSGNEFGGGGGGGSFLDPSFTNVSKTAGANSGDGFVDIEPAVSSVPEPSTLTLLGLGSLGLLGYGRRRRNRAAA
jgi:hypothetical protein